LFDKPFIRRIEDCPIGKWETEDGEIVRWWTLISSDRTPSQGLTVGIAEIAIDALIPKTGHLHEKMRSITFLKEKEPCMDHQGKHEFPKVTRFTFQVAQNTTSPTLEKKHSGCSMSLTQMRFLILSTSEIIQLRNKYKTHNPCG